mgnify:CR=1 FL=1
MEYWWEGSTSTAIPQTFTSDVVGQYNKIGGITFRAALIKYIKKLVYISNNNYFNFNAFMNLYKKRDQQKHQTSGIFHLVFVKLTSAWFDDTGCNS